MHVKFYGTRGSLPVANKATVDCGGNTTCLRVESDCIPERQLLIVDAGSGIMPLGYDVLGNGIQQAYILFTHYHHDHIQGLPFFPQTYMNGVAINCFGPLEDKTGPKQMLEYMMRPPFFPVCFARVASHFDRLEGLAHPDKWVMVFHPEGGYRLIKVDRFQRASQTSPFQIRIGSGHYPIGDCLVVHMYWSHHPERTISYRFEEKPTGKVFAFLTDHENTDRDSQELLAHLRGADFLVMDSQYHREVYDAGTVAGYGHGTPDYCVRVAQEVGAQKLGLTHHNPTAIDADVNAILAEAQAKAGEIGYPGEIIALSDYLSVEV